jgi:hypothetical protein
MSLSQRLLYYTPRVTFQHSVTIALYERNDAFLKMEVVFPSTIPRQATRRHNSQDGNMKLYCHDLTSVGAQAMIMHRLCIRLGHEKSPQMFSAFSLDKCQDRRSVLI